MQGIAVLALLFLVFFFWLRSILDASLKRRKAQNSRFEDKCSGLKRNVEKLEEENAKLEEKTSDIVALYDITREICKTLDEALILDVFRKQVDRFLKAEDCRFLPKGADLTLYSAYVVLPLIIGEDIMGHLAAMGVSAQDTEKFLILARQFIAGIKRAILYNEVQKLTITDSLTGTFNRRYFLERLAEEFLRSQKFGHSLSFLMVDIDHFKGFNDRYGHLVGDVILREIAGIVKETIRQVDFISRYGGEELSIALTETDREQAGFAAERVRHAIESAKITAYDESLNVTASIGTATFPGDAKDVQALIDKADSALYHAKQAGRNRVCAYTAAK